MDFQLNLTVRELILQVNLNKFFYPKLNSLAYKEMIQMGPKKVKGGVRAESAAMIS